MANLKELEKYLDYEFSSNSTTGRDYIAFQNKYIGHIKHICLDNDWKVISANKNHYCFSVFIKNMDNKFVYLSIRDVRHSNNAWYTDILIRRAKHEKDFTGGNNNYTRLDCLATSIQDLFNGNS